MRYILTTFILTLTLHADTCDTSYAQSKEKLNQVEALIKNNIASHKAYEIINNYLDTASLTIASCANSKSRYSFRFTREVSADMKRIALLREKFRVQTFNELKLAAIIQAKKEVQCTNVYNNNFIRRDKEPRIQPVP